MKKESETLYTNEDIVENKPNAAILIDALQNIGYDNISAIADIVITVLMQEQPKYKF